MPPSKNERDGIGCGGAMIIFVPTVLLIGGVAVSGLEQGPQVKNKENHNVKDTFPKAVTRWQNIIEKYALERDLDPNLIAAVILQESGGNRLAYSRSGAVGLMQVMSSDGLAARFMCVNGPCFADRPSTLELMDAETNIEFGVNYLADLISLHGNLRDALKAYGPMDVDYLYADKVLALYRNGGQLPETYINWK